MGHFMHFRQWVVKVEVKVRALCACVRVRAWELNAFQHFRLRQGNVILILLTTLTQLKGVSTRPRQTSAF